jgi:hypothetical protein
MTLMCQIRYMHMTYAFCAWIAIPMRGEGAFLTETTPLVAALGYALCPITYNLIMGSRSSAG